MCPQEKAKYIKILTLDFISSEETGSESGSDEEMTKKKIFLRNIIPWRSSEVNSMMECLDRKTARRRTERAKEMCRVRKQGLLSTRPMPDGFPEWAVTLASTE